MKLDKIVCECMQVTNGMIKDAVTSGITTFEELQDATGAATVCGACADNVQRVLDYFATERDN